jgi:hypothetical protein
VEDTLTAHLAVEDRLLADFLNCCHQRFCPTSWFEPAFEWVQADLKKVIEEFQKMGKELQPTKHLFLYDHFLINQYA